MTSYFKKNQQPQKKERKNKVPPRRKLYVNSPKGTGGLRGLAHGIEQAGKGTISLWQCQLWTLQGLLCDWQKGLGGRRRQTKASPLCSMETLIFGVCYFSPRTLLVCNPGKISNHKMLAIIFCNLSHALLEPWWDGFLCFSGCILYASKVVQKW